MTNDADKKKLKEIIDKIVKEETRFLNENVDIASTALYQTFIQPFADVFNTAKAELTKLTAVTFENVKKLAKQSAYLVIPFIAVDAIKEAQEEADRAIKQKIATVDEKYRDVYQRTWSTLQNRDVLGLAFLLGPLVPLGSNFALAYSMLSRSPGAILGMVDMLSGGHPGVARIRQRYAGLLGSITHGATSSAGRGMSGSGGGGGYSAGADMWGDFGYGGDLGESFNRINKEQVQNHPEQPGQKSKQPTKEQLLKQMTKELQQLINSPEIQTAMAKSPITKDFQEAGIEAITNTLKPVLSSNSIEDLKKAVGKDFAKIEAELQKNKPEQEMTPEMKKQFDNQFVEEFKEIYKTMIINQIQQAAGPGTEKLVNKVIQQIKSS
jgi:hypothetical protein